MAGHVHGATSGRLLWISLIITLAFVGVEVFFGFRARSLALLSDAGHNASDALALGLAAYGVWIARRPATSGKTFGYHRVAILTALLNASVLVLISIGILAEAASAFRHPRPADGALMMAVAAVALLMNTVIAYMLRDDSHRSLNARAAYVHMAGDALSSVGVLAAGALVRYTGWTAADPAVSVIIAVIILYSAWGIIEDATNVLMEGTPKNLDVAALVEAMRSVEPVRDVHDLHVWTVGDGIHFLSCHVVLPDTCTMAQATCAVAALNDRLHDRFGIGHATIQTEIGDGAGCRADSQALYCGTLEPHGQKQGCAGVH
jgi:cobalt-zinc-cadmium efflux system protein